MASHAETAGHHAEHPWYTNDGKRAGLRGFLTSTNHKRIGILYLSAILTFFTIAVILGVLMRIQMLSPDSTFLSGQAYNSMFTIHGIAHSIARVIELDHLRIAEQLEKAGIKLRASQ